MCYNSAFIIDISKISASNREFSGSDNQIDVYHLNFTIQPTHTRCISKILVSTGGFWSRMVAFSRDLGLHFSMAVLDVMVTNLENIISSATDLLLIFSSLAT